MTYLRRDQEIYAQHEMLILLSLKCYVEVCETILVGLDRVCLSSLSAPLYVSKSGDSE